MIFVECTASDFILEKHGFIQWTPTRSVVGRDFRLYYSTPKTEHFAELWVGYESLEESTIVQCDEIEIPSKAENIMEGIHLRKQYNFELDLSIGNYSKSDDGSKQCLMRMTTAGHGIREHELRVDLYSNEDIDGGQAKICINTETFKDLTSHFNDES